MKLTARSGKSNCLLFAASVTAFILTANVSASERQMLQGHVPAITARLKPTGLLARDEQLHLAIGLPLRNQTALQQLLVSLYDPANPKYRQYLSPAQFAELFGPSESDYQAVISFAKSNNLSVTGSHPNRMLLDVSGSAADIEKALHVTLQVYQHPSEQRMFYGPDTEPSLDLAVPVLRISGLDNYSLPRPRLTASRLNSTNQVSPNSGSGPSGTYMGHDFRAAYVADSSLNGSGQVVGLLQFDGYTASDIAFYENKAGLPSVTLMNVLLDGFSGNPTYNGGEVEVSLDIEMCISMAPGLSKIIVYEAGPNGNWHDILNRMATDNLAKQLSCSWYVPGGGPDSVADQIFQEMAAQGQSFFNASGDYDAYTGLIDFPGDTPYLTQVGGTMLTTSGPGGTWVSETVWNRGNGIGSGGGISTSYSIPSWQAPVSMVSNQGSPTMRNTPDVALTAESVYVRADSWDYNVGGTSCAAPLWAGFAALANQRAAAAGKPAIGFVNPALYTIGQGGRYSSVFHDITTGNNTSSASPNRFYAVTGYDLCTGWGTPTGFGLINALATPDDLNIIPGVGFSSFGRVGGPFAPSSEGYTLTNTGTSTLNWSAGTAASWLSLSPTNGTLNPGGQSAVVQASISSAATTLPMGTYSALAWFTNLTSGVAQSLQFNLSVLVPPAITNPPSDQQVIQGGAAVFVVGASGSLPLAYQWRANGTNLADNGHVSGSATPTLTINNVSPADVHPYSVVVTNLVGAATSSSALLIITSSPPVIATQPVGQTVLVGNPATFSVGVEGTPPFAFQWRFNNTNALTGATNSSLTLLNVQSNQAGLYSVFVTNSLGSVLSSNAQLVITTGPPCDPPSDGLAAWWRAEGNSLDSGGTNDALPTNVSYTLGEVGQAFSFNGTNAYLLVPSNPNISPSGPFTVESWVNYNSLTSANGSAIVAKGNDCDCIIDWAMVISANARLRPHLNLNGGWYYFDCNTVLLTNTWYHLAMDYDGTNLIGYVNGIADGQIQIGSGTVAVSANPLRIGVYSPGQNYAYFAGSLDEVSLYNQALSPSQIQAIYNAGVSGKCFVQGPPVLVSMPTNQTVVVGSTAAFSVAAIGTRPLIYQWSCNGTNLSGATNSTLSLANLQVNQSGTYSVTITNIYGSTNASAVLSVYGLPPNIVLQPRSQTNLVGQTAHFSVAATGTAPLSYQWVFNSTNLVGATNTTLTLTNLQLNQSGAYSVLVTNAFGSTNSANALLVVNPIPPCAQVPAGIVSWWRFETNALDSAGTNNGLLQGNTAFGVGEVGAGLGLNGTNAYVVVSNSPGISPSGPFTVESWINYNKLTSGNGDAIVAKGADCNCIIDWALVISAAHKLRPHLNLNGGWYYFDCNTTLNTNTWYHVALVYDGTNLIGYVNGLADGQLAVGAGNVSVSSTPLRIGIYSPAQNYAFLSGIIDEVTIYSRGLSSNEVQSIYVEGSAGKCLIPPSIVIQPHDEQILRGGTTNFGVLATGAQPLSYQWSLSGTNIAGATNASLLLANVSPAQAGDYAVLVSNAAGSISSSNAALTVFSWPTIDVQPISVLATIGCNATFSVNASGTTPLLYQWWKNSQPLTNQVNSSLILTNLQSSDFATYYVVVNNAYGSATSSNAVLAIDHPPVANSVSVQRFAEGGLRLSASAVLANDTDPDRDPLTLVAVSSPTDSGGTVFLQNGWVYYLPPGGYTNADRFVYTVSDGHCGGTAFGSVTILVRTNDLPTGSFTVARMSDGSIQLVFIGKPEQTYRLQFTPSLSAPNWQDLTSFTTDIYGGSQYIDTSETNTPARYYRCVSP